MYTASIYFLGQYRPAYFQADTASDAVAKAFLAVNMCQGAGWFRSRLREANRNISDFGYSSSSSEHGCRGVSLRSGPHDPWLDSVTAKLPAYPGLDYTGAANV